jgi:mono/diheme cytochrome c family protein
MKKTLTLSTLALATAFMVGVLVPSRPVMANQKSPYVEKGRKLFMRYCASCHGTDGKGEGPVTAALKGGPRDLTLLQAPEHKFPFSRVQTVIDGEKDVPAHGTRKMPVWGTIFRRTSGDMLKNADIYALVRYVESIQSVKE